MANLYKVFGLAFPRKLGVFNHLALEKENAVGMFSVCVLARTLTGLRVPKVVQYLCIIFENHNWLWILVTHLYLKK